MSIIRSTNRFAINWPSARFQLQRKQSISLIQRFFYHPSPPSLLETTLSSQPSFRRTSSVSFARFLRFNSTQPQPQSLSQRFRSLSREYGYSAIGVYLLLCALDFPFCFLAVRWIGTETIGHWEHAVVDFVKNLVLRPMWLHKKADVEDRYERVVPEVTASGNEGEASIWTQLALAYAVHKSLIIFRVPLTAAVTPKVVRVLRGWGWNIGRKKPGPGISQKPPRL